MTAPDGERQLAYKHSPLYIYDGDAAIAADRVVTGPNDALQPVIVQEAPHLPPGVIVTATIIGHKLANASGMTLYEFVCNEPTKSHFRCDMPQDPQSYRLTLCGPTEERCAQKWQPFLAAGNVHPTGGLFSVAWSPNGIKVWTYRGRPLYTYSGDERPGQINGNLTRHFRLPGWFIAASPPGEESLGF